MPATITPLQKPKQASRNLTQEIEQTRGVAVNVLGRQPAKTPNPIKPDVLNDILDRSLDDAKRKITNRSPELKELIKELNSWIVDEEK
jgi:hypothetical protein